MVEAAHQALANFVKKKEAAAVLIDSTSDKAFCAGMLSFLKCHAPHDRALHDVLFCCMAGGDIRDIRRAVLDQPYDKDPPLTHRAARV